MNRSIKIAKLKISNSFHPKEIWSGTIFRQLVGQLGFSQDLFRTVSGLFQDFLMIFLRLSWDFLRTCLGLSQDFLWIFSAFSQDNLRIFSGLCQNFLCMVQDVKFTLKFNSQILALIALALFTTEIIQVFIKILYFHNKFWTSRSASTRKCTDACTFTFVNFLVDELPEVKKRF